MVKYVNMLSQCCQPYFQIYYTLINKQIHGTVLQQLSSHTVSVADCRGEWAVRLPHAPPHGKPVPLLADEARSDP
jgi:hypothetical protein